MVICIQSMVVIRGKNTNRILGSIDKKIFVKFDNYHDFGFDVYQPKNWWNFLRTMKFNGKLLPRKTEDDFRIVYRVYFWGIPKDFPRHTAKGSYFSLFPGYTENGETISPLELGYLD